jgi:ABC-2 type transport system ATP-binding protein
MRSQGKTIFLTTHYMEEAEKLCDRVAIVDHGKIITLGSPTELIRNYFQESAIEFEMEAPPAEEVFQVLAGATQVNINGPEVIIYSSDIPSTMSGLLNYAKDSNVIAKLKSLRVRQATLEDVFLKLTGRKIRE